LENVVLTIHLILALLLIGVVLMQRSEGGGLGMGGNASGTMSARGAATAMTKLTWIFAAAFIVTSITLPPAGRRADLWSTARPARRAPTRRQPTCPQRVVALRAPT
jgi:preprotein translocase subunit SecG